MKKLLTTILVAFTVTYAYAQHATTIINKMYEYSSLVDQKLSAI